MQNFTCSSTPTFTSKSALSADEIVYRNWHV